MMMKRIINKGILLIMIAFMICYMQETNAQPRPGANGDSTAVGGTPLNGSSPIGSGLVIFLLLSAGYGVKKMLGGAGKKGDFEK
jgi:hypothetical protein